MPYWKLYYHFIWGTKEHLSVILPAFESDLYRVIAAKVKELDRITYAIGGIIDHRSYSSRCLCAAENRTRKIRR
jgi:putative transposase